MVCCGWGFLCFFSLFFRIFPTCQQNLFCRQSIDYNFHLINYASKLFFFVCFFCLFVCFIRCIISGTAVNSLHDVTDQRDEESTYYCTEFYRGQQVRGPASVFKDAKWIVGLRPAVNNQRSIKASVEEVSSLLRHGCVLMIS